MRRILYVALGLFVAITVLAALHGTSAQRKSVRDQVSKMEECIDLLKTIRDEQSAKSAKPGWDALQRELGKLQNDLKAMDKPSQVDARETMLAYSGKMLKARVEMENEWNRVHHDVKAARDILGRTLNTGRIPEFWQ